MNPLCSCIHVCRRPIVVMRTNPETNLQSLNIYDVSFAILYLRNQFQSCCPNDQFLKEEPKPDGGNMSDSLPPPANTTQRQ